ncbi:hypothetical protein [Marichromatium gracile]|uniref:hypothetical protein n=1 Tax=Marichromatium gracile TaxID=1048 RepID=UPI001047AB96|nr:hypothetical protein [Marichromatium gracile]
MNHLLEKAFKSLSVTCNKSSLHALDEDRIKVTLRTLHNNGIEINPPDLESWLIENNWQKKPRSLIVTWAKSISDGSQVKIKNKESAPTEKEIWDRLTKKRKTSNAPEIA